MTAAFCIAAVTPAVFAAGPSATTDPGFNPQTGQINAGDTAAPWSATPSRPQDQPPSQEEARAALMVPDPVSVSSLSEAAQSQNSSGQATTGAASATGATPQGPIGATLQTMPAKYSHRNDLLDHVPTMAWPLRLNEQQRQKIYQTIIAGPAQPAAGLDKLKPTSSLSYEQLRDSRPLPSDLSSIDALHGLKYIRDKNRILLVRPPTGIVVDQIAMR
jgi:hypothetical protein